MKKKPKAKLIGNPNSGWSLTLSHPDMKFKWDVLLTDEELLAVYSEFKNKLKKRI